MRLQKYLNEKYFKRIKDVEIFVNPSKKDLQEIFKSYDDKGPVDVRFIIDNKKKKVYIWDARKLIHIDVWDKIKKDTRKYYDATILSGHGEIKNGKVMKIGSDSFFKAFIDKYDTPDEAIKDFKWASKYNIDGIKKIIEDVYFFDKYMIDVGRKERMNEEYHTRARIGSKSFEVFININSRDYKDLSDIIRFIADNKTKTLYVWDAYNGMHKQVWRQINNDNRLESDPSLLIGVARKKGARYFIYPEDTLRSIEEIKKEFNWIQKYMKFLEK